MLINFFFFNDTATTEIYTLSLHDALPISPSRDPRPRHLLADLAKVDRFGSDRKSTRLNSSHSHISYAVFCLKKKNAARRNPTSHNVAAIVCRSGSEDRMASK